MIEFTKTMIFITRLNNSLFVSQMKTDFFKVYLE